MKSQVRAVIGAALAIVSLGCATRADNRVPIGEAFPSVRGKSLQREEKLLPDAFKGDETVVLIGYVMDSQFDIDRWLLGFFQLRTPVRLVEVPAVRGMIPGMIATTIDDGMRSGIPEEDWGSVVTVYSDANEIARFTGTRSPRNARVLLLDAEGRVVWFHDRGYSAAKVSELDALVREMQGLAAP